MVDIGFVVGCAGREPEKAESLGNGWGPERESEDSFAGEGLGRTNGGERIAKDHRDDVCFLGDFPALVSEGGGEANGVLVKDGTKSGALWAFDDGKGLEGRRREDGTEAGGVDEGSGLVDEQVGERGGGGDESSCCAECFAEGGCLERGANSGVGAEAGALGSDHSCGVGFVDREEGIEFPG